MSDLPAPIPCSSADCPYTTPDGAPTWDIMLGFLTQHTAAVHQPTTTATTVAALAMEEATPVPKPLSPPRQMFSMSDFKTVRWKVLFAMGRNQPLPPHDWVNICLILTTAGTFLLTAVLNGLAGSGAGVPSIFYSSVGDISDKYQLHITPAGFTFVIWTVIYIWLAISIFILIICIFINTDFGRLYLSPLIASPAVTVTLSINFILNIAWIFVWDRCFLYSGLLILATVILILIAVSNILVMFFMARNIVDNIHCFTWTSLFWWGIIYRLILNGLGVYTTWTVIASLLNLAITLVYTFQVEQRQAALVALSLLVVFHCSWFAVENFLVDSYARYILTPYLVVIWAANGIRAKQVDDPNVPQDIKDYVLAVLIIAVVTFVARLVLVTYKVVKSPIRRRFRKTYFGPR